MLCLATHTVLQDWRNCCCLIAVSSLLSRYFLQPKTSTSLKVTYVRGASLHPMTGVSQVGTNLKSNSVGLMGLIHKSSNIGIRCTNTYDLIVSPTTPDAWSITEWVKTKQFLLSWLPSHGFGVLEEHHTLGLDSRSDNDCVLVMCWTPYSEFFGCLGSFAQ